MGREYLRLALIAFLAYSLVAPLLKIAMADVPSTTAVFLSNFVLLLSTGVIMAYRGESPVPYLRHRYTPRVALIGVLLTIALLAYYHALSLGPVSVVVPIFGLFIVVSSLIGITVLDEVVTVRKVTGIGFSVLAIVLISL